MPLAPFCRRIEERLSNLTNITHLISDRQTLGGAMPDAGDKGCKMDIACSLPELILSDGISDTNSSAKYFCEQPGVLRGKMPRPQGRACLWFFWRESVYWLLWECDSQPPPGVDADISNRSPVLSFTDVETKVQGRADVWGSAYPKLTALGPGWCEGFLQSYR